MSAKGTPDVRDREDSSQRFSPRDVQRRRARRWVYGVLFLWGGIRSGLKRGVEILVSGTFLLLLAPVWAVFGVLIVCGIGGVALVKRPRVGRRQNTFNEYAFTGGNGRFGAWVATLRLNGLPVLWNIFIGDMAFVGPRLTSAGELDARLEAVRIRYRVRPGLIGLWWLRERTSIDYGTEVEADGEYVERRGLLEDLGILLRAIPALLYGGRARTTDESSSVLGIPIDNLSMAEAVDSILARLEGDEAHQVCFVNAACANIAYRDPGYRAILRNSALVLADGIGMKLAGRLLRREIRQNVNGTDMFPLLCEALEGTGKRVFLLGARPGIVEAVQLWIEEKNPGVTVVGHQHGYYTADEEESVVRRISECGTELLIVAFGVPGQEEWIERHLSATGAKVGIGVGGLFDFYSGRMARAPLWLREMGFEWSYRLYKEPGRMWKRYIVGNVVFLTRVLRERVCGLPRFLAAAPPQE